MPSVTNNDRSPDYAPIARVLLASLATRPFSTDDLYAIPSIRSASGGNIAKVAQELGALQQRGLVGRQGRNWILTTKGQTAAKPGQPSVISRPATSGKQAVAHPPLTARNAVYPPSAPTHPVPPLPAQVMTFRPRDAQDGAPKNSSPRWSESWAPFHKLLNYYIRCVEEDERPGLNCLYEDIGKTWIPIPHAREWSKSGDPKLTLPLTSWMSEFFTLAAQTKDLPDFYYGYPVETFSWIDKEDASLRTFITRTDEDAPALVSHRGNGARIAAQVTINPLTELGRRPGFLWVIPWPHEGGNAWKWRIGPEPRELMVNGGLRRASGREILGSSNVHSIELREAIDHLCGYFTESRSLVADEDGSISQTETRHAVVKIAWEKIWARWADSAAGTEPRTARVVEIARVYLSNIRDVCERPRRMLIRHRELVSVGKIQELDETCLRDLIRRPGRTIPEKAGSRQELLGITRRETVDTAENRVIRDLIRLCQLRAVSYRREYPQPRPFHPKVQSVVELQRNCERWDAASPIAGASKLVGIPKSNYVLEKDRRYRSLWNQYQLLRREEEMVDGIWPWARCLWADFVRSLVVGFMSAQSRVKEASWHLAGELPAYVRSEHSSGTFVPALSISSRWKHIKADQELWIVHGAHAHLCPGLQPTLPRLGADLLLVCFEPGSAGKTPAGILVVHSMLSLDTSAEARNAAVESLAVTLDVVAKLHPEVPQIKGLLLRGEYLAEAKAYSKQTGRLDYLSAPVRGSYWFTEFPENLSVLLEELRS